MSYIDDLVVPLSRKEVQEMFSSKSEYARIMNDKFKYLSLPYYITIENGVLDIQGLERR